MPFKIVRNDITKMNTEAIVNTTNDESVTDPFITPGFDRRTKFIINVVNPLYENGNEGEEEKLRACYKNSLRLAKENAIRSVAFPLLSTGSSGYPKEEGMRIALDEIRVFLLDNDMDIYLVVSDDRSNDPGHRIFHELEEYIDRNYVEKKEEYPSVNFMGASAVAMSAPMAMETSMSVEAPSKKRFGFGTPLKKSKTSAKGSSKHSAMMDACAVSEDSEEASYDFSELHVEKLDERMKHLSDTFSEYLMYLIDRKQLDTVDVYKRAVVDRKIFSKLRNNTEYHPQKITALCLCVGARLNLDESKDLLARAGYALSPCDKTDIIFSYFIENEIYDMIELDIQLEEHGLPCIIQ